MPNVTTPKRAATLTRDMPDGTRIVARAAIDDHGTGPYFSVTADVWEARGRLTGASRQRSGRDIDMGGCLHDEILAAFPQFAPLVALHLSDAATGEPMHALANARYFWRGEHYAYELKHYGAAYVDRQGTGEERAARTLRCSVDDLPPRLTTDDDGFAAFVDTLRPRWSDEAAAGRALLATLPAAR